MPDPRLTHRRIQHAIEAMRAIGLDEIRAMTADELLDFSRQRGLVRVGELAPGGAAGVEQRLPADLPAEPLQPRGVDALLLEVVERDVVRVRREPGTRLLHRVAVGNAVEFHGVSTRGRPIGGPRT